MQVDFLPPTLEEAVGANYYKSYRRFCLSGRPEKSLCSVTLVSTPGHRNNSLRILVSLS